MESKFELPIWTWIGGGLAVLCLFVAIVLAGVGDGMERGEKYGQDPDDLRVRQSLAEVSVTMMAVGALVLGAVLLMTGLAVENPGWARVAFIVVGAAVLVPVNIL